jgi:hypothetical protein
VEAYFFRRRGSFLYKQQNWESWWYSGWLSKFLVYTVVAVQRYVQYTVYRRGLYRKPYLICLFHCKMVSPPPPPNTTKSRTSTIKNRFPAPLFLTGTVTASSSTFSLLCIDFVSY